MDIGSFGITAVPVITVIVFLVCEAVKVTPLDNKWLPVIAGFVGGCLGVIAMLFMPEFPAVDPLTAIAIGIVSGLAATGAHQIYKQLTKGSGSTKPETVDVEAEEVPVGKHEPSFDQIIDDMGH